MKRFFTYAILLASATMLLFSASSCKKDDPDDDVEPVKRKMTMLVYAVVSNLDLESDKAEMLKGAANIDLDENGLFVYQVYKTGLPQLLELSRNAQGDPEFQVVKVYDRSLYSTDPERISSVIDDVIEMSPSDDYGLVFWSHATGWTPSFPSHGNTEASATAVLPSVSSFGADLDTERDPFYTDHTDIDELADAIPDHTFRFIWFDVCYMGGIETVYQLRNKCEYYIGMPTEDPGNGMPYDVTLPYLLKENPDCVEAARLFFNYYASSQDSSWAVATIGVYYTPEIEPVAQYCQLAYAGAEKPSSYALQDYSRGSNGPFYDFGQYTRRIVSSNENAPAIEQFDEAMEKFVVYKAATRLNFAGKEINQENYSGLSCHLYDPAATDEKSAYYRTLDWFKKVYEGTSN